MHPLLAVVQDCFFGLLDSDTLVDYQMDSFFMCLISLVDSCIDLV
jgi:hypothetical protein